MRRTRALFQRFLAGERGFETVEYAILLGLVVAGSILILVAIGNWVNGVFTGAQNDLGA
jgi:Flp pilus assembly pilin Flp